MQLCGVTRVSDITQDLVKTAREPVRHGAA